MRETRDIPNELRESLVVSMLGSIRHQLLLPEQKTLFDYWRQQSVGRGIPSYTDIDPSLLGDFLPTVSLMELQTENQQQKYKFRLAGTEFYNFFEREITGRCLNEVFCHQQQLYWQRIYDKMIETKRPRVGVTRSRTPVGAHMLQFWIRLPLSCDGGNVNMILGFDKFVKPKPVSYTHLTLPTKA